ncbi:hypothetical protein Cylst_3976 [Cylindrospermum stagnale PCC 7417]|uniref:Uncharacterized protein n=1 Tax=Cylindrospermum stagnale PCC 7417 TaxID=56107 RepID=K9X334_9NOST|nr:hypothetical protein Cylst_3976 [Cylindrospermum stagnale PCC 7417]
MTQYTSGKSTLINSGYKAFFFKKVKFSLKNHPPQSTGANLIVEANKLPWQIQQLQFKCT